MQFNYRTNADTNHKSFQAEFLLGMHEKFKNTINDEKFGFFHLTSDHSHVSNTKELFNKYKDRKYFVQIGIGGSALGPQMLIDALGKNTDTQFVWLDNTDAEFSSFS